MAIVELVKANASDERVKNLACSDFGGSQGISDVCLETTKYVEKTSEGKVFTWSPVEIVAKSMEKGIEKTPLRRQLLSENEIKSMFGNEIENISLFVDCDQMLRIAFEKDGRRYERDYLATYNQYMKQAGE